MKNKILRFFFVLLLAIGAANSFAFDLWNKKGAYYRGLSPYSYSPTPRSYDAPHMNETIYNKVMDRLERIYAPIVHARGYELEIMRRWRFTPPIAYAERVGRKWIVTVYGGFIRYSKVANEDALALVTCHEIGHHLGGMPKMPEDPRWGSGDSWLSTDGQADYFAALKCFRKYVQNEDNIKFMRRKKNISASVVHKCNLMFFNSEDAAICQRTALAGLSLTRLFRAIQENYNEPINIDLPDTKVVTKTLNYHPSLQCRLDTYFAAALCPYEHNYDLSDEDPHTGACSRSQGDLYGTRPLCWYRADVTDSFSQL